MIVDKIMGTLVVIGVSLILTGCFRGAYYSNEWQKTNFSSWNFSVAGAILIVSTILIAIWKN